MTKQQEGSGLKSYTTVGAFALYTDDGPEILRLQPRLEERFFFLDEVQQLFDWR